jgi:hypothetical protein
MEGKVHKVSGNQTSGNGYGRKDYCRIFPGLALRKQSGRRDYEDM